MRSASAANDGRPASSSTTISPSSTALGTVEPKDASSGYAVVISAPLRANIRSRPPSINETARTPSHLNSYAQPSPRGNSPAVASIGATGNPDTGLTIRCFIPLTLGGRDAGNLEGRGVLRTRVDRGEALLRDGREEHPLQPGAP